MSKEAEEYFKENHRGFYSIISNSYTTERKKQLYEAMESYLQSKVNAITDEEIEKELISFCDFSKLKEMHVAVPSTVKQYLKHRLLNKQPERGITITKE